MDDKPSLEQILEEQRERLKRLDFVHSGANEVIRRNPKTRRIFEWLHERGYRDAHDRWLGYCLARTVIFLPTDYPEVHFAKKYRKDLETIVTHLEAAAELLRLPRDYFFDKLPPGHPDEGRLADIARAQGIPDREWFGNHLIGKILSLMGTRGRAKDLKSGYKGAVVLLLDEILPLELPERYSAIANLMKAAKIDITRDSVKTILKNNKARRNPPKFHPI